MAKLPEFSHREKVYTALEAAKKKLTIVELALLTGLHTASVSVALHKMCSDGIVDLFLDPGNAPKWDVRRDN